jgi:uncharacterized membrane protein
MYQINVGTLSLMAATVTTGLSTGAFALYAHTIMPALKHTDDKTFVTSFQAIDRAIINPWFIGATFLGTLAATTTACVVARHSPAAKWTIGALIGCGIVVAITAAVHVPANDAIKAVVIRTGTDFAAVRSQFSEQSWAMWNLVRTVASLGSFGTLIVALSVNAHPTI